MFYYMVGSFYKCTEKHIGQLKSTVFGKYLRGHKTDLQQKRPEFSKYCIFGRLFPLNRLIFCSEYDIIGMDTDNLERRYLFAKRQQ